MNKLHKISSVVLIIIIALNLSVIKVNANDELFIWTKSAILMEAETGKVLAESNSDKPMPPASLSKIMTFLIALEAIKSGEVTMDDRITISEEVAKVGSSSYRLRKGEVVDFRELLESMMIVSSNASAVAIAEHISGSEEKFVLLMNQRAKELGMENTYFINPHGLPIYKNDTTSISNMSTAEDLAILCRYLLNNFQDETLNITNKRVFSSRYKNYSKSNTNPLLSKVTGVDGIKTGYTGNAGYCLAFTKEVDPVSDNTEGMRLIGIVLGAGNETDREKGSKALLNYGTENFYKKTIINKGDYVGEDYLYDEKDLPIRFLADDSFVLIKEGDPPEKFILNKEIVLDDLSYPIKKGDKIGVIKLTLYDDRTIYINLVSDTEINELPFLLMIKLWWKDFFKN